MKLRADAVFEGGGVKGIGFVGAVAEIEKAGYEFVNLAGTSRILSEGPYHWAQPISSYGAIVK